MTVIWPRLRACFRTPSHYKSGRQECDWVSRPVSPLRSVLLSLPLSVCPATPFHCPDPPTSRFRPSHLYFTFYLSFVSSVLPPPLQLFSFPSSILPFRPFPEFIHPPISFTFILAFSSASPGLFLHHTTHTCKQDKKRCSVLSTQLLVIYIYI